MTEVQVFKTFFFCPPPPLSELESCCTPEDIFFVVCLSGENGN